MLTIEEIKKELDAGREVELECVDKNDLLGTINPKHNYNQLILESSLQVSRYFIDGEGLTVFVVEPGLMITEIELEHFRIKRPAPNFDDLIDVAVKAVKDKLIIINAITDWQIQFVRGSDTRYVVSHDQNRISKEIDFINSLYTETFMIESEEDILKINNGATVELSNGNSGSVLHLDRHYKTIQFAKEEKHWGALGIFILKGATVTQKRSAP